MCEVVGLLPPAGVSNPDGVRFLLSAHASNEELFLFRRLTETLPIDINAPDHAKRIAVRETLEELARAHNVTRSQVAFAWLLKHPANIIPVIGSANVKHIQDAARAAELDLTREEWYRLIEAAHGQRLP